MAVAAGVAGTLAGLLLVAARFPAYAEVGGASVTPAHGPFDLVATLLWAGALVAAGVSVVAGRLPRLGLAVIAASGAVALGRVLGELYHLQDAEQHRAVEILFGQRVVTSSVAPLTGVWLQLSAYLTLSAALVLVLLSWPRTLMEDAGDFDVLRPRVMGVAALAGVLAVLAVAATPQDVPDEVVQDVTGFRTTVDVAGGVSLLDRNGLDLLSGVVVAAAIFVVAMLAPTLRPRLAAVGAFAGLAAYLLSSGLLLFLEAGRSDDVVVGPGGWLQLVSAVLLAALALYSLRAGRSPAVAPTPPRSRPAKLGSQAVPASRRRPRRGA